MIKVQPTKERLDELFRYEDGKLIRKMSAGEKFRAERAAGSIDTAGFMNLTVDGVRTNVHTCVWIMLVGEVPWGSVVEHLNGVRDNNEIENLHCRAVKAV